MINDMNNNRLNNNNLIWEEKGITVGIINFLLNNIKKIRNVYIEDVFYYKIIKYLFPVLKTHNKLNVYPSKKDINIIIKSSNTKNINNCLIINNINNVSEIKTKKKYFNLLPWFNSYNPIIMFKYNKNIKEIDMNKLKKKIHKFSKKRLNNIMYTKLPMQTYKCNFVNWDMYVEFYVLKKYSLFFDLSVDQISDYLYRKINSFNCTSCNKQPKIIPVYIPMVNTENQYNKINQQDIQSQLIKEIQINNSNNNKKNDQNDNDTNKQNNALSNFINLVNNKMSSLNNILQKI
jgi:hypothetical protein